MAERALSRARADAARLGRERSDLAERALGLQRAAVAAAERLDRLRLEAGLDRAALERWAAAERAKAEDGAALEGYAREDGGRARELELGVARLTREAAAARAEVEAEATEARAAQAALDRAAGDFRRLHAERAALAAAWDEAAAAVGARDGAIAAAGAAFAERRRALRARKAELDARAARLEDEEAAHREAEARVALLDRDVVGSAGVDGGVVVFCMMVYDCGVCWYGGGLATSGIGCTRQRTKPDAIQT